MLNPAHTIAGVKRKSPKASTRSNQAERIAAATNAPAKIGPPPTEDVPLQRIRWLIQYFTQLEKQLANRATDAQARRKLSIEIEAAMKAVVGAQGQKSQHLYIMQAIDFGAKHYIGDISGHPWAGWRQYGDAGLDRSAEFARHHIGTLYPAVADKLASDTGRALLREAIIEWINTSPGIRPGHRSKWAIIRDVVVAGGGEARSPKHFKTLYMKAQAGQL
jgi:hypothetical protein